MLLKTLIFPLLVVSVCAEPFKVYDYQPQQVHIAYGDSKTEMIVTWSTMDATNESQVEYTLNGQQSSQSGRSKLFIDGGKSQHRQYIHKVALVGLQPNAHYVYRCGSHLGWSAEYWFETPPLNDDDWSPHVAIFGDMGNENAQSLARLQTESQQHLYVAIIHVGDFAYDMDSEDAAVGDAYMRQIEPLAAYVPYMVCAGNHEEKYNFSNYRARFNMPGDTDSLFYSFDMGPVHFIGFQTEFYYFLNYGIKSVANQFNWLKDDLRKANENRQNRPWIVTFGHRPMYCSNDDEVACKEKTTYVRDGLPVLGFGLEDLFVDNGVDVTLWAHKHSYERLWPVYNFQVKNGSTDAPYTNAGAPIHIITGSAGCKEEHAKFVKDPPEWSAYRSNDYGYTRMKAHNKTHLYFEQVSDDQNGKVIDSFWVIKDRIAPAYANLKAVFGS